MNFKPIPINARLNSMPGVLDSALGNLLASFNAGSLVPVPRGVQPEAAPTPLAVEARAPGYLRRLATSDVAVSLGGRSGLVAIKFEDRPGLDDFLARDGPVSCRVPGYWRACYSQSSHVSRTEKVTWQLASLNASVPGNFGRVARFSSVSARGSDQGFSHCETVPRGTDWTVSF